MHFSGDLKPKDVGKRTPGETFEGQPFRWTRWTDRSATGKQPNKNYQHAMHKPKPNSTQVTALRQNELKSLHASTGQAQNTEAQHTSTTIDMKMPKRWTHHNNSNNNETRIKSHTRHKHSRAEANKQTHKTYAPKQVLNLNSKKAYKHVIAQTRVQT